MTDRAPPHDHRREVTDKVIELMEAGTAPWQQPWKADTGLRIPHNPTTQKPYRGGNILGLWIAGLQAGFTDSRWMTFNQARTAGWSVRKGEKSVARVQYFEMTKKKDSDENDPDFYPMAKTYAVFNGSQVEGIPPIFIPVPTPFEVNAAGEAILQNSGADLRVSGDKAYYNRRDDYIRMPDRERFPDSSFWYGTALHELTHWSGAANRLNRKSLTDSKGHGDDLYVHDEMVADLASAFMSAERGIPYSMDQTAAYIASWVKALKDDKHAIFRAASDASRATDYLLAFEKGVAPELPASHQGSHVARIEAQRQNDSPSEVHRG